MNSIALTYPEASKLRDRFAAAALTGFLTTRLWTESGGIALATACYNMADAMLEARDGDPRSEQ